MRAISSQQVTLFFRHMSVMLQAGIPLVDAVHYLEQGELEPHFQAVLADVHKTLISGFPLGQALAKHAKVFPGLVVELVQVGEKTGALVICLEQVAALYERQMERRQKIASALAYPACLMVVMALVIVVFVKVLGPRDQGLLGMLGDDVPWPSQILLLGSDLLSNPLLVGGAAIALAFLLLTVRRYYLFSPTFRRLVDGWLLGAPILGKLIVKLEASRALDALASSLRVGLSMLAALANANRMVANTSFREGMEQATLAVRNGEGLGVSLGRHAAFPRLVTSLVEVGEVSGELEAIITRTSRILDEEVNDSLDQVVSLAEPILLAAGGAAAAFVAVATFLPVMRLVATLG